MFIFFDSFCLLFIMSTPHLSPSPFYPQLVPLPPPRADSRWGPYEGEGGGGGLYSVERGGGGGAMCRGGGGLYVSGC